MGRLKLFERIDNMQKVDCFASGVNGKCGVTTKKNCEGCSFYKTDEQFRGDFKRHKKILADRHCLSFVIDKYPVFTEMCAKIG